MEAIGLAAVLQDKDFQEGMKRYTSGLGTMETKTKKSSSVMSTAMKGIGLGLLGGIAAVAGGIGVVTMAAADAEKTSAQLNSVLASTKGVAGMTREAVIGLGDSLSMVTTFEDDAIVDGENLLLTFTGIGKNVFPMATEAMLNMSTAMGQDVKSSAIQLGKALNEPVTGAAALRRVGVQLTDQQEAQIKSLVKLGKTEEAQKIILNELSTEFGGAAKAAGATFSGKLTILQNRFTAIQEQIGGALLPAFTEIGQGIIDAISSPEAREALDRFATWLPGALKSLGSILTGTIIPAIQGLWNVGKELFGLFNGADGSDFYSALYDMFGETTAQIIYNVVQAFDAVRVTVGSLGEILSSAVSPIDAITQVLYLFGYALEERGFTGANDLFSSIGDTLVKLEAVMVPIIQLIMKELSKFWTEIQPKLAEAWSAIVIKVQQAWDIIKGVVLLLQTFISQHFTEIRQIISGVWTYIQGAVTVAWNIIKGVIKIALDLISGNFSAAGRDWKEMMSGIMEGLKMMLRGAWEAVGTIIYNALQGIAGGIRVKAQEWVEAIRGKIDELKTWLGNLPGEMERLAQNMMIGLINGFWLQAQAIQNALNSIIWGAIDRIKKSLGMASPSKVMMGIGENMAEGLVKGFASPSLTVGLTPVLQKALAGSFGARNIALPNAAPVAMQNVTNSRSFSFTQYGNNYGTGSLEAIVTSALERYDRSR